MQHFVKRALCTLLSLVLCALLCGCGSAADEASRLEVLFFAAGKADAILLATEHACVLIDCGQKGFGRTIVDELERRGIEKIDTLILTHFDQDHVGGAAKVINSVAVDTVLQSNFPRDSEEVEKFEKALLKAGIEPQTVRETLSFTLDGLVFTVDPPRKTNYIKDDSNNSSLIVTVQNGAHCLLFMGDAESERIAEYLADAPAGCDLIKMPHHGEKDLKTKALLDATAPRHAVITCSAEEPNIAGTLHALEAAGAETWLTSVAAVLATSDGQQFSVQYLE